jgi:hypothetical protein
MSYMIFVRAGVWIDRLTYKNIFLNDKKKTIWCQGQTLRGKEGSGYIHIYII